MIKTLIIDEHKLFRESLKITLRANLEIKMTGR